MKKISLSSFLGGLCFLLGIGIMAYPSISEIWNRQVQTQSIVAYQDAVRGIDKEKLIEDAIQYNEDLLKLPNPFSTFRRISGYEEQLAVDSSGMMGWITIDKIDVKLGIYHGTESDVLSHAVGHLQGSSLPVGGESSHSVLMAHRGLPSATLFSNLDKLELGDIFCLSILDYDVYYMVDQIEVVQPGELDTLYITEGKDYCTLITCTPYGINTDRLLVRGIRTDPPEEEVLEEPAIHLNNWIVAGLAGIVVFLAGGAGWLIYRKAKASKKQKQDSPSSRKSENENEN